MSTRANPKQLFCKLLAGLCIALGVPACVVPQQPAVVDSGATSRFVLETETVPLAGQFSTLADSLVAEAPALHARVRSRDDQRIVLVVAPAAIVDIRATAGGARLRARYAGTSVAQIRVARTLRVLRRLAVVPAPAVAPAPEPAPTPVSATPVENPIDLKKGEHRAPQHKP